MFDLAGILQHDLPAFLVTAQDSIYYLTGVTSVPLERPFFILRQANRPDEPPGAGAGPGTPQQS